MRRALVILLAAAGTARAHGGLPLSETIIESGGQLLVPTKYWGVFFGSDGGPWRWICEEAINMDQPRRWAYTLDGTYHVTDYQGLTSSRDRGCTWVESTGPIAQLAPSAVVADPVDGKRAWATTQTGSSMAPMNGLFTTGDDGVTWTAVKQWDEFLRGVALSSDGKTIYVVGVSRAMGAQSPVLHVSTDGGASFTDHPIAGAATTLLEPLAVDPADAKTVWLHDTGGDPPHLLLQSTDGGASFTQRFSSDGAIGGIELDGADVTIAVGPPPQPATPMNGIFRSTGGGAFQRIGNLSQAQCVKKIGQAWYACSWNYAPDQAAIARSDDGGATWKKVFQYADTVGPTESCPASTPVGTKCPAVWQMYADQLGIDLSGGDMAGGGGGGPGCKCAIGRSGSGSRSRSRSGSRSAWAMETGTETETETGTGSGTATETMGLLLAYAMLRRKAARPA